MRLGLVAFILVALALPAGAVPDAKLRAREAYRLATQHYNLGEYPEALTQFKEAYRLYEDSSFLFNIGQCHRQMGNKQEAIRFYRTYLANSPNTPNRDEISRLIQRLQHDLDEEVRSAPPTTTHEPGKEPPVEAAATPSVTRAAAPAPVYKKWWFWTAIGAVVVVGVAVGVGVGLGTASSGSNFPTTIPIGGPGALQVRF